MEDNIYIKTIKNLPMFFDIQLKPDSPGACIFEPLREFVDFDEAFIFFLNPDSIKMQYIFSRNRNYSIGDIIRISPEIKDDLFSVSSKIFGSENELVKLLGLKECQSFLISKLKIRNTVYGAVLLCKREGAFYEKAHIDITNAISAVLSYKIKDAELSEIFKVQLKALQENFAETRMAYKTIEQQNIKILAADKVKNEFLANVSHELRTPLNAIIGFSEMLSTKLFGDLNDKQLEYVSDISISGIHLLGMINELLDISKIEAKAMTLNKTDFSITLVVDEVVNIVKPLADKKFITIKKNIVNGKNVYADFQKIKQILYNLLSNAINFSSKNGEINVNVSFAKNSFIIEVSDNGPGIAPQDHTRIFEKFVQLENAYTKTQSSTGLGLTITKELVEMHGGKISLKSALGEGASFIVRIPNPIVD